MRLRPRSAERPAVFHVTHYKAGSQWIHAILRYCVPEPRLVKPVAEQTQFLREPVREGMVYPTLYVTREEFESTALPQNWRRFVVIRDLRDTLVSGYFSVKISHPEFQSEPVRRLRQRLRSVDQEDGLIHMIETWLMTNAHIQESWLGQGEPLLRYEDLVDRDLSILEPVLIDRCELGVGRRRVRRAVRRARFERLTGGRARGREDITAHQRKGVVGDWRNHFTPAVKEAFKERHGHILVAAGYEPDLEW